MEGQAQPSSSELGILNSDSTEGINAEPKEVASSPAVLASEPIEEEDPCPICFEHLPKYPRSNPNSCPAHFYHYLCICGWARQSTTCPTCRCPFTSVVTRSLNRAGREVTSERSLPSRRIGDVNSMVDLDNIILQYALQGGYDHLVCRVCQTTYEGDDDRTLICDMCENGYHLECLNPPLNEVPDGPWYCRMCTVARRRDQGVFCGICQADRQTLRTFTYCRSCFRNFHPRCAGVSTTNSVYYCTNCESRRPRHFSVQPEINVIPRIHSISNASLVANLRRRENLYSRTPSEEPEPADIRNFLNRDTDVLDESDTDLLGNVELPRVRRSTRRRGRRAERSSASLQERAQRAVSRRRTASFVSGRRGGRRARRQNQTRERGGSDYRHIFPSLGITSSEGAVLFVEEEQPSNQRTVDLQTRPPAASNSAASGDLLGAILEEQTRALAPGSLFTQENGRLVPRETEFQNYLSASSARIAQRERLAAEPRVRRRIDPTINAGESRSGRPIVNAVSTPSNPPPPASSAAHLIRNTPALVARVSRPIHPTPVYRPVNSINPIINNANDGRLYLNLNTTRRPSTLHEQQSNPTPTFRPVNSYNPIINNANDGRLYLNLSSARRPSTMHEQQTGARDGSQPSLELDSDAAMLRMIDEHLHNHIREQIMITNERERIAAQNRVAARDEIDDRSRNGNERARTRLDRELRRLAEPFIMFDDRWSNGLPIQIATLGRSTVGQNQEMRVSSAGSHAPERNPSAVIGEQQVPNEPSTSNGRRGPSTSSGGRDPSTSSGRRGPSTSSGHREPSTSNGRRGPSTSSGGRDPSTSSGRRGPSTSSGHREPSTSNGRRGPSTSSGGRDPSTSSGRREPRALEIKDIEKICKPIFHAAFSKREISKEVYKKGMRETVKKAKSQKWNEERIASESRNFIATETGEGHIEGPSTSSSTNL